MPVPTGQASFLDIQNTFGGSNPIAMTEYYGAATGIPASGQISVNDFRGQEPASIALVYATYLTIPKTSGTGFQNYNLPNLPQTTQVGDIIIMTSHAIYFPNNTSYPNAYNLSGTGATLISGNYGLWSYKMPVVTGYRVMTSQTNNLGSIYGKRDGGGDPRLFVACLRRTGSTSSVTTGGLSTYRAWSGTQAWTVPTSSATSGKLVVAVVNYTGIINEPNQKISVSSVTPTYNTDPFLTAGNSRYGNMVNLYNAVPSGNLTGTIPADGFSSAGANTWWLAC